MNKMLTRNNSYKILNELLNPMGISLMNVYDRWQLLKKIEKKHYEHIYLDDGTSISNNLSNNFSRLNDVIIALCICKRFKYWDVDQRWKNIENMYYGCNSLEEMMIKKDLNENE